MTVISTNSYQALFFAFLAHTDLIYFWLILLLFSPMSWNIHCSTNYSNQTVPCEKELFLRANFNICCDTRKAPPSCLIPRFSPSDYAVYSLGCIFIETPIAFHHHFHCSWDYSSVWTSPYSVANEVYSFGKRNRATCFTSCFFPQTKSLS